MTEKHKCIFYDLLKVRFTLFMNIDLSYKRYTYLEKERIVSQKEILLRRTMCISTYFNSSKIHQKSDSSQDVRRKSHASFRKKTQKQNLLNRISNEAIPYIFDKELRISTKFQLKFQSREKILSL